jgi:hypothetical protein
MKKLITMSLAAAAMTAASSGAQAVTLSLSQAPTYYYTSGSPNAQIIDNGNLLHGGANIGLSPLVLEGTLDGNSVSLFAYCIDVYQAAMQDNFTVVSLLDYLSDVRSGDAVARYNQFASLIAGNSGPVDAQVDGAVQAAVWELRYETAGNPLNAFAGDFHFDNVAGNTPAFDPNALLTLPTAPNPAMSLWVAKSAGTQDLLFWSVSPVPEPGSWAMMIAGMAAVGYAMRSSRRKRPVSFA